MRQRLSRLDGYVWCERHGCIHTDTLNPYDYGDEDHCIASEHRAVYARSYRSSGLET